MRQQLLFNKSVDRGAYYVNIKTDFNTAEEAFEHYYRLICVEGRTNLEALHLPNIGFYVLFPQRNVINTYYRCWDLDYNKALWERTRKGSKNRTYVNYGDIWNKNNRLLKVIEALIKNPKNPDTTILMTDKMSRLLSITFAIDGINLNMTVTSKWDNLWNGFSNDQFIFSNLQMCVAQILHLNIGWCYYFTNDLYLGVQQINKDGMYLHDAL